MLVWEGQQNPLPSVVRIDGMCGARLPVLQDVCPELRAVRSRGQSSSQVAWVRDSVRLLERDTVAGGDRLAEEASVLRGRDENALLGEGIERTVLPFFSLSSSKPPNLASVRTTSKSSCEYSTSAMVSMRW